MFNLDFDNRAKKLAPVIGLLACTFLYAGMVLRSFAAYQVAGDHTSLEGLQRARALEPGNADYLMAVGRNYFRRPKNAGRALAMENYHQALRRNPFNPWCWYQLAHIHLQAGDARTAEYAIQAAERLSPHSASMALSAALFRLDQGKLAEALQRLRMAFEYDPESETEIFELCEELELDITKVLDDVLPPKPPLLRSYLVYLINNEQPEAAQEVWQRLMQQPQPFQGDYPFNGVATYIDTLLRHKETQKANVVWGQFQERWPDRRAPTSPANMISNGSFEEELLNGGFDWRFVAGDHVRIQTDNLYKQGGEKSLVITFDGKENLRFENVYQLMVVEPSTHYHFSGYMRTESITSDMGPRFEIRDYYDSNKLLRATDGLVGSNEWSEQELDFTTGPNTRLLAVYIARTPSWKLASLIGGKVWVDNLRLQRLSR